MGAEDDTIRSEIENARARSQEDRKLQRVRNARIDADEQVRNVHTRKKSLHNARKRQQMAKENKLKLHECEVELAKEVYHCMLHAIHYIMNLHKTSFHVTLGTWITFITIHENVP